MLHATSALLPRFLGAFDILRVHEHVPEPEERVHLLVMLDSRGHPVVLNRYLFIDWSSVIANVIHVSKLIGSDAMTSIGSFSHLFEGIYLVPGSKQIVGVLEHFVGVLWNISRRNLSLLSHAAQTVQQPATESA
jgi:hypothetical protein